MNHPFLVRKPRRGGWVAVRSLVFPVCFVAFLSLFAVLSASGQPRSSAEPHAEPAIPAIFAAFDRYDLIGMPADHGLKDLNDLILTLIRDPTFAKKVNDIEIECGNSLYQDLLDLYTSGADVPFRE